jgi:hypothetical protein
MRKRKLGLYYGTVKSVGGGRHFMAWANSREHALNLVEAVLTAAGPVQGSVVGPVARLPADVMKPGRIDIALLASKQFGGRPKLWRKAHNRRAIVRRLFVPFM